MASAAARVAWISGFFAARVVLARKICDRWR
jgi:hypothetical protein